MMDYVPVGVDSEYSYPLHSTGSISTVEKEVEKDIGKQLRDVYEEVSGKKPPLPEKRRIGFLP